MSTLCAVAAVVMLTVTTERSPLQDYGDAVVGRWIGDITLVADWPGIGKKGEKVVGHEMVRWIVDGHAVESELHVGHGVGNAITVWDPVAKVIRMWGTTAGTGSWSSTIRKEGATWIDESVGWLEDGTKTAGTSRLELSDDGMVRTYTGSGFVGDKQQLPLHDVYRRVDAEPGERTLLHELGDLLIGRWRGDLKLITDWSDLGKHGENVTGYVDFEWIADRQAIPCTFYCGNGQAQSVIYWDSKSQAIRQVFVFSSGLTRHEIVTKQGEKWKFEIEGSMRDGTEFAMDSFLETQDGGRTVINTGRVFTNGRDLGAFHDIYTKLLP